MVTDWGTEIAIAWRVLECTRRLDTAGLWEYHLPRVAATQKELGVVEAALGFPLDPMYRAFLAHADGWPDFYQSADLFGSRELLGDRLMGQAIELISVVDSAVWRELDATSSDVLPIALAKYDKDVFLLVRPPHRSSGQVIWLAGTVVERFPNFDEFFLSMVDYNRVRYDRLKAMQVPRAADAPGD